MKKYQKIGMFLEAKKCCIGIIKGIQEFERASQAEFKDWAIDAPSEYIDIMNEWKEGHLDSKDIAEVEGLVR